MDAAAAVPATQPRLNKVRRGRRGLWLLLLISLLLILIVASRITSNWHYVVTGNTGEVLYTATFDDLLSDWDLYEGRLEAQTSDGVLRIRAETSNSGPFSVARPHFSDFDYRVQAKAVDGPLNNGFGVIFRLQDKDNTSLADDSYYLFLVSSDGYYQVRRVIDGVSKELSVWIPSSLVHQDIGAVNHLRVIASDNRFQFFINGSAVELCIPDNPDGNSTYNELNDECVGGEMVDTFTDMSIPTGQLGVVVVTLNDPDVTVEFDNVLVLAP
jgi:hypothetical protein